MALNIFGTTDLFQIPALGNTGMEYLQPFCLCPEHNASTIEPFLGKRSKHPSGGTGFADSFFFMTASEYNRVSVRA
jgi:hypothetical protein